jgi:hypothetical protein
LTKKALCLTVLFYWPFYFYSLWMNTMNRCFAKPTAIKRIAAHALFYWAFSVFASQAWAQEVLREFPAAALRGVLEVAQPPLVLLDGKEDRLTPGARIRGPNNLLVMSGMLVGRELVVNYVREGGIGQIHEVWILTPEEAKIKREKAARTGNVFFSSELDDAKSAR